MPVDKEIHYFDARYIASAKFFRKRKYQRLVTQLNKHDWPKLSRQPELMAEMQWLARQALVTEPDDQWYCDLFAHTTNSHRVIGEITPAYAGLPTEGFAHIAALAPEARVLFIMRNPVDRLWSAARYFSGNRPKKTVVESLDDLLEFAERPMIAANGRYEATIANLRAVLPEAQLHFMFYEELFASPEATQHQLAELCGFLGLDPSLLPPAPVERRINPSPELSLPDDWRRQLHDRYESVRWNVEELLGSVPASWKSM